MQKYRTKVEKCRTKVENSSLGRRCLRFLHSSGREPLAEFGLEIQASLMDGGDSTGALVFTQQQLAEVQSRVAGGIEELQSIRLGLMLHAAVLASVCVYVCLVLTIML